MADESWKELSFPKNEDDDSVNETEHIEYSSNYSLLDFHTSETLVAKEKTNSPIEVADDTKDYHIILADCDVRAGYKSMDSLPPGHKIYTVTLLECATAVVMAMIGEKGDGFEPDGSA